MNDADGGYSERIVLGNKVAVLEPDEMATKVDTQFYLDARDVWLKALVE